MLNEWDGRIINGKPLPSFYLYPSIDAIKIPNQSLPNGTAHVQYRAFQRQNSHNKQQTARADRTEDLTPHRVSGYC